MANKRSLPLCIIISMFLVTIGVIPLSCHLMRQAPVFPCNLVELTERLSQSTLSVHVVPVIENEPESGIYICKQRQTREQLFRLLRGSEVACKRKWQGVVYCENIGSLYVEEHVLQGWGDHGMRIGPLLFFGDPALLDGIHEAIRDSQVS